MGCVIVDVFMLLYSNHSKYSSLPPPLLPLPPSLPPYSPSVLDGSGLSLPPTITPQTPGLRDPVVLSCRMPRSTPVATVTWTRNSETLGEAQFSDGEVGITLSGSLVISSFDGQHNGRYSCSVHNAVLGTSLMTEDYLLTRECVCVCVCVCVCAEVHNSPAHSLTESSDSNLLIVPTEFVAPPTPPDGPVIAGDTVRLECFTTGT